MPARKQGVEESVVDEDLSINSQSSAVANWDLSPQEIAKKIIISNVKTGKKVGREQWRAPNLSGPPGVGKTAMCEAIFRDIERYVLRTGEDPGVSKYRYWTYDSDGSIKSFATKRVKKWFEILWEDYKEDFEDVDGCPQDDADINTKAIFLINQRRSELQALENKTWDTDYAPGGREHPIGTFKTIILSQEAENIEQYIVDDKYDEPRIVGALSEYMPSRHSIFGLIFFDEINKVQEYALNRIAGIFLEHRLGNVRYPGGFRVVAAGNREQDQAGSTKISDTSILRRLFEIKIIVNKAYFDNFMKTIGTEYHPVIYGTLKGMGIVELLESNISTAEYSQEDGRKLSTPLPPDRRFFDMERGVGTNPAALMELSDLMYAVGVDEALNIWATNLIGLKATATFKASAELFKNIPSIDPIISAGPSKYNREDIRKIVKSIIDDEEDQNQSKIWMATAAFSNSIANGILNSMKNKSSEEAWFMLEIIRDLTKEIYGAGTEYVGEAVAVMMIPLQDVLHRKIQEEHRVNSSLILGNKVTDAESPVMAFTWLTTVLRDAIRSGNFRTIANLDLGGRRGEIVGNMRARKEIEELSQ